MIYYLLLCIILIYIIVLIIDRDFFSPSAIICASYFLAVFFATLNIKTWNINLSFDTFKMIIIGILSFVIPSVVVLHTCLKEKKQLKNKNDDIFEYKIKKNIFNFFVFLQFIVVFLYFYYVIKTIGGVGNIFNLSSILNEYREGTSYGDLESQIPTYLNQMVKISQIMAYFSLYDILYKKIFNCGKCYKVEFISIFLFVILSLLSGGRYKMISLFLGGLVMWNVLYRNKFPKKKFEIKKIAKIIIIVVSVMFIFSISRTLVGRTNDSSFLTYISSYFGGSIQLLDLYLRHPVMKTNIWGQETFYGINLFLSKLGLIEKYRMHLEFRSSNGVVIGNVYTAFRCFYHDFGYHGVIMLQAILAIFWSNCYKKINLRSNFKSSFNLKLILYSMFISCLFLNSYRDSFFSSAVSFSTITIIIYLLIMKKLCIEDIERSEIK